MHPFEVRQEAVRLDAVVFRFGKKSDIRYPKRVPECGERILHRGEEWEVVAVETRSRGSTTCVLVPVASSADVSSDLLERVQSELDRAAWNLPEPRLAD